MGKTFRQMVADARGDVGVVSPQDAKKEIDKGGATVIDVREPDEIAASGTVPGARSIPRGVLEIKADTELPQSEDADRLCSGRAGGARREIPQRYGLQGCLNH